VSRRSLEQSKLSVLSGFAAVSLLFTSVVLKAETKSTSPSKTKPNIIIILADDLGWRDVGYHGSEIQTPNIDRIAAEGIELDRFYAQPVCSPTRAALMTGKSPMRLGITNAIAKNQTTGLPLTEKLLPEQLAELGYQSLMVGKWHLGHYTPDMFPHARGFEHFYGHVSGGVGYWDHNHGGGHDWQRNGTTVREEGYSTRLIADEAIRILTIRDRFRPTFLYVAFNAPHLPNEAPTDAITGYEHIADKNRRVHAAMVNELDREIGRVVETLETEDMLDNSIVFFASDNGGLIPSTSAIADTSTFLAGIFGRPLPGAGLEWLAANFLDGGSDNRPLADGKASVAEGGVRVPAAIRWPHQLRPRQHVTFMSVSDLLPTLLEAIGESKAIPSDLDGHSQWGVLSQTSSSETPDYVVSALTNAAIYRSPWKLVIDDDPVLYNVYSDPEEATNVATQHPQIVEDLKQTFATWPRAEQETTSVLDFLLDPDTFGGEEDREPWADVARKREHNQEPSNP